MSQDPFGLTWPQLTSPVVPGMTAGTVENDMSAPSDAPEVKKRAKTGCITCRIRKKVFYSSHSQLYISSLTIALLYRDATKRNQSASRVKV
jgi:hypothetical protein